MQSSCGGNSILQAAQTLVLVEDWRICEDSYSFGVLYVRAFRPAGTEQFRDRHGGSLQRGSHPSALCPGRELSASESELSAARYSSAGSLKIHRPRERGHQHALVGPASAGLAA